MAKVVITRSKLDSLANSIAAKSGVPVTMTIDEMKTAVDGILVPAGTLTVTENGVTNVTAYENVDVDVFVPDMIDQVSVKSTSEEQVIAAGTIIAQNTNVGFFANPIVTGITFENKKYYVDFMLGVQDGSTYIADVKQIVDFTDSDSVELEYIDREDRYYAPGFSERITSITLNKNGNLSYTYTGWNEDLGMGCYINVIKVLDSAYATIKVEPFRLKSTVQVTPSDSNQLIEPGYSDDVIRIVGTLDSNETLSTTGQLPSFYIPVNDFQRSNEMGPFYDYRILGQIDISDSTSSISIGIDTMFRIVLGSAYKKIPYEIISVNDEYHGWGQQYDLKINYGQSSNQVYIYLTLESFIIGSPNGTTVTAQLTITENYPYDGLSSVRVGSIPSQYIIPTGSIAISNNGTVDVTNYASAVVNIPVDAVADAVTTLPNGATAHNITGLDLSQDTVDAAHLLYGYTAHDRSGNAITGAYQSSGLTQSKTITPSESQQTVTPDSGYDALSSVVVEAIESTYVGSGITQNPTLTASGASVIVPAGYYSTQKTKSVSTAAQATPSVSINSSGLITATATQSAGYVSAGTKNGTLQLTTKSATTIIPSDQNQTAVSSGVYTTGNITVAGDNNLVAGNIKNGVSIFGVSGTYTGSGGGSVSLQAKTNISPTESSQTITPDSGYDGLSSVQINAISSTYVGSGITSRSSSDLTASGATVTVPAGYYANNASTSVSTMTLPTAAAASTTSGYTSKATISRSTSAQYINIPPGYNSAGGYYTISATPNGSVTAPSSISGSSASVSTGTNTLTLSKTISVTPNVTTAGYISSGTAGDSSVSLTANINTRSSSDLTASGATVTVPAGYYASEATKSVTTMTLPTSTSSSATSGYTSKATVGRSTSNQYINIPPGYNSAGGYYTISAVPNGTATAPSSISGTSATVSTGTNTLTLTKTVSVTPNISTAGYISSGTAGNSSVSLTASVTTKAAATYNVSSSDQTIASGTYLTGTQTIRGVTVSGLSAGNIASGVTVKIGDSADDDRITSVTGTLAFQTIYSGSSNPSSGTGVNGDIYIKTS